MYCLNYIFRIRYRLKTIKQKAKKRKGVSELKRSRHVREYGNRGQMSSKIASSQIFLILVVQPVIMGLFHCKHLDYSR